MSAVRRVVVAAFPTDEEARLVDGLRADGDLLVSLVADEDGKVVGHIAFSPVTGDGCAGVGLAPVAVSPSHQKRGIGVALIEAGLEACRARGDGFVVVLGDPKYYGRFGFERASAFGLGNEYGVDEEFMVLELTPGALTSCSGVVRYCDAFRSLE